MGNKDYTSYEEGIMEDNTIKCRNHRKSLGLPIDIDLLDIECKGAPCYKGCPV